ncbi:MAG: hypothetical protein OEY94_08040 [Alphaproteobacteria bacterium]|nr:hypothetical protein [Alphaproteobacteria bacterium]
MAQSTNSLEFNVLPWKNNGLEVYSILSNVSRNKSPEPENFIAIHKTMSDLSPLAALLYAAEAMLEIANCNDLLPFEPKFLKAECSKMRDMCRYGLSDPYDTLHYIEEFNSLLDLCYVSYETDYPLVAEIIDILRKQLNTQIVIMDEVLDIKAGTAEGVSDNLECMDNVIAFPGCSVKSV